MKSKQFFIILLSLSIFMACKNEPKTTTETNTTTETKATTEVVTETTTKGQGQSGVTQGEGEDANVWQVAMTYKDEDGNMPFSTLVAAVKAAGVEDALVNAGPLTVFAPVNSAFAKIQDAVDDLLKPENKEALANVLVNHVAPSNYPIKKLKKEAKKGRTLYMASGEYLSIENKDGKIFVGGTEILMSVKVSNGWIHVIGDVLVPTKK